MANQKEVANNIKDIRKSLRMSQENFADSIGMKLSRFRRLEANGGFTHEEIEQIARTFNVSVNFIYYGTDTTDSIYTEAERTVDPSRFNDSSIIVQDNVDIPVDKQKFIDLFARKSLEELEAILKLLDNEDDKKS